MTNEELEVLVAETEEYASLITQYNYDKPKFNILARSVLRPGVDMNGVMQTFCMAFDIDNAVGSQLDLLGKLIGLSRLLDYTPSSGSREMSDDEYRLALRLTIAKNTWDGSLGSVRGIYADALGSDVSIVYVDNQDMSIDINVYGGITTREAEMMERAGLLLVPVGVSKTVYSIGGNVETPVEAGVGIYSIEWVDYVYAE